MQICFYAPFKPLGHPNPSGDLIIAGSLFDYLRQRGHRVSVISRFRSRWVYWKPWCWPLAIREMNRVRQNLAAGAFDLWLTYHAYYKAPDLLGPVLAREASIPYVIFQGAYATKYKKKLRTWPGYVLNRQALLKADHIFTNKRVDQANLQRLLPPRHITYLSPGIAAADFNFDPGARSVLRRRWAVGNDPVIVSAAMFRPDVKSKGLRCLIRTCGDLLRQGQRFCLVIAGDGEQRPVLTRLAEKHLGSNVRFVGKLPRNEMARFYSAGDLFVFPGFNESLGMVYLEAQACGLPVVAYANGGIPEVVKNRQTGLLVALNDTARFADAINRLLDNPELRQRMGTAASVYVRRRHDVNQNYQHLETTLQRLVSKRIPGIR